MTKVYNWIYLLRFVRYIYVLSYIHIPYGTKSGSMFSDEILNRFSVPRATDCSELPMYSKSV